jgi:hypothetical protein
VIVILIYHRHKRIDHIAVLNKNNENLNVWAPFKKMSFRRHDSDIIHYSAW